MGIVTANFINNYINLDDADFHVVDPKTINHVTLLAWHNKLKQCKEFKKEINKGLMLVAWHPIICWDWFVPEDVGKEI